MAKMKTEVPQYGTIMQKGIQYYRTRIMDADGKQVSLYAAKVKYNKPEELFSVVNGAFHQNAAD